jgi:hypothetical protein
MKWRKTREKFSTVKMKSHRSPKDFAELFLSKKLRCWSFPVLTGKCPLYL